MKKQILFIFSIMVFIGIFSALPMTVKAAGCSIACYYDKNINGESESSYYYNAITGVFQPTIPENTGPYIYNIAIGVKDFYDSETGELFCPRIYKCVREQNYVEYVTVYYTATYFQDDEWSCKPLDAYDSEIITDGCNFFGSSSGDDINRPATCEDFLGNLTCGETGFRFHKSFPNFTSVIYDLLKIATPIIIIITGMLDFLKAASAQKEDDIKKAQQKFLRRLLAGAVVFLIFVIVETVINLVAESNDVENAMDCVNCFLNGARKCTVLPGNSCK